MLNFIPLYTNIWTDKGFRKLPNDSRLLFLYLISNESITLTGIYTLDIDVCKLRVKLNNNFDEIFQNVISSKMVEWDAAAETIFIVNRFKLIPTNSAKVLMGAIKELNMTTHPFREDFITKYKEQVEPFLCMVKGYSNKYSVEHFYKEDTIKNLARVYSNRLPLKRFLMNRGGQERRIDEIINRILPNLK